jgi:hypothetical protein
MRRLVACLVLFAVSAWADAKAMEVVKIAGKEIAKQEEFEVMFEDKRIGHMISFTRARTTTHETKGIGLFDAVTKICSSTWDLLSGAGSVEGFCSSEKDGDKFGVKWNGMCNSAEGSPKAPVLRCGGGWTFVPSSGTGRFTGLVGGGTWIGNFLPTGDFQEEWSGVYRK